MQNHVGIVAQIGVERVVLQVSGVQVLSGKFIAAILSDDSFEVLHGEEVRIVPGGCLKGYCESTVEQLIVSLIDEGRSEVRFITVGNFVNPESRN